MSTVTMNVPKKRVFPLRNSSFKKVSVPDKQAEGGWSSIMIDADNVSEENGMCIVTLNPEIEYDTSRKIKDADGKVGYIRTTMQGSEIIEQNTNLEERNKSDAGLEQSRILYPDEIYDPVPAAVSKPKSKGKAKAAAMGAAAGYAASNAVKDTDNKKSSIGQKLGTAAGITAAVGVGGVMAGGAYAHHKMTESITKPIQSAIADIIMSNASPLERQMRPIGVSPDKKDVKDGYDFDMG